MKIDMCHHGWARSACDICTPIAGQRPHVSSALDRQVGGDHYKDFAIQPVEYIYKNNIPFMEGCAIKYLTRWRDKGGIADLEKARHFIDMLIELEKKKNA